MVLPAVGYLGMELSEPRSRQRQPQRSLQQQGFQLLAAFWLGLSETMLLWRLLPSLPTSPRILKAPVQSFLFPGKIPLPLLPNISIFCPQPWKYVWGREEPVLFFPSPSSSRSTQGAQAPHQQN